MLHCAMIFHMWLKHATTLARDKRVLVFDYSCKTAPAVMAVP
jgi:hypothetical protein